MRLGYFMLVVLSLHGLVKSVWVWAQACSDRGEANALMSEDVS